MNGGISVHCVDVARGRVAVGLPVRLARLDGSILAEGRIGPKGLWEEPILMSDAIGTGGYQVSFDVGGFYRAAGVEVPTPAFLEVVRYDFHVCDAAQHWHLPFKFTPWGYSLFRGGA